MVAHIQISAHKWEDLSRLLATLAFSLEKLQENPCLKTDK